MTQSGSHIGLEDLFYEKLTINGVEVPFILDLFG